MEDRRRGGADDPRIPLEISVIRAAQGHIEEAVAEFKTAYEAGYRFIGEVELDPMFDPLRRHSTFQRIVGQIRADVAQMREQITAMEEELEAVAESPRP